MEIHYIDVAAHFSQWNQSVQIQLTAGELWIPPNVAFLAPLQLVPR
ncbi:hypothetical protein D047_1790 [Vibrio parahaemolyticus VPTS-2010_2]|nr:hypothetical protein D047_1790 [Vibrio parahaemolyticus VPTS-2010_2]